MIPEEELRQMYCDDGMTQMEIAEVFGVSSHTISNWMKKCGVELCIGNSTKPSREELCVMYRDKSMTQIDIAELYQVHNTTISRWIKEYGIELRILSKLKPSKKELDEMYCNKMMSIRIIADKFGVHHTTVSKWLRLYGIKSRMMSDYRGDNHYNWRGGISFDLYCEKFNNEFKEAVRKRDDCTCQLCGFKQNPGGIRLSVHHVHYNKDDCWPDVVTLCNSCHTKTTNGDRNYWEEYFENHLIERGLMYWSLS